MQKNLDRPGSCEYSRYRCLTRDITSLLRTKISVDIDHNNGYDNKRLFLQVVNS